MASNKPEVYNFLDHYRGNTFDGAEFTLSNAVDDNILNDTPINLTACLIKIQFKKDSPTGNLVKEINVGSGITITNAINGIFLINPFKLDWDAGVYCYDIEVTFSNSVSKTYVKGKINVIQDTTNG